MVLGRTAVVGLVREGGRDDFAGTVCELGLKLAGRDTSGTAVVRDAVDPIRDFWATPLELVVVASGAVEPILN